MKEDTPTAEWVDVGSTEGFKTNLTVPNLDTEKKYLFKVAAGNEIGLGEYLQTDKPAAPTKAISKFLYFFKHRIFSVCTKFHLLGNLSVHQL